MKIIVHKCVYCLKYKMSGYVVLLILYQIVAFGACSSLLCGNTHEVELGSGAGEALALALGPTPPTNRTSCQLKLVAPDAAAFAVRLIDVKDSMSSWERGRKWNTVSTRAQDTADHSEVRRNNTHDACTLVIFQYVGEMKTPIWRMSLCGGNAAVVAARAGARLLPPRLRLVWTPPVSPSRQLQKLRLVVTAVSSGIECNNESQFMCGGTGLCISSFLVCDSVRHCLGGEDEDAALCARHRDPPLLELMRRLAAMNQEIIGIQLQDGVTKPSVIMKINETEQKTNALTEIGAALKPYGPWGYLVVGMLICATVLMFCLAWECCCKRSKPSDTPIGMPAACIDLSPTVSVTAASQHALTTPPSPPEYEPPPTYSSLFPRAYKSSPTPVPHCSHETPPD